MNLELILENHQKWLNDEKGGELADLEGANLYRANLRGANLYRANLESSNLRGANLSGANLSSANLSSANLNGANLRGANLSGANLSGANLRGANLYGANLYGANLSGCSGDRVYIKSIFVTDVYPITYTGSVLQIGCQCHPIEDWWEFDDAKIIGMNGKTALKFWREWKDMIKMIIEKSPAKSSSDYRGNDS
jgi:uncharacterized protein YjbI with pentapeptide repeats